MFEFIGIYNPIYDSTYTVDNLPWLLAGREAQCIIDKYKNECRLELTAQQEEVMKKVLMSNLGTGLPKRFVKGEAVWNVSKSGEGVQCTPYFVSSLPDKIFNGLNTCRAVPLGHGPVRSFDTGTGVVDGHLEFGVMALSSPDINFRRKYNILLQ